MSGRYHWHNVNELSPRSFVCGYCSNPLSANYGYFKTTQPDGGGPHATAYIYICHHCTQPTVFYGDVQTPGARFGENVQGVTDAGVESLYAEARDAYAKNAYTASVLTCRRLLMHIAVSKGAEEGKKFIEYVEFLSSEGYVPKDAKGWVDQIRDKGNEANHEIVIMTQQDAKDLLSFSSMLLKLIYEFPSKVPAKIA